MKLNSNKFKASAYLLSNALTYTMKISPINSTNLFISNQQYLVKT